MLASINRNASSRLGPEFLHRIEALLFILLAKPWCFEAAACYWLAEREALVVPSILDRSGPIHSLPAIPLLLYARSRTDRAYRLRRFRDGFNLARIRSRAAPSAYQLGRI